MAIQIHDKGGMGRSGFDGGGLGKANFSIMNTKNNMTTQKETGERWGNSVLGKVRCSFLYSHIFYSVHALNLKIIDLSMSYEYHSGYCSFTLTNLWNKSFLYMPQRISQRMSHAGQGVLSLPEHLNSHTLCVVRLAFELIRCLFHTYFVIMSIDS